MKPRTLLSHLQRAQMMKTSLGEDEHNYAMHVQAPTHATGAFEIHVLDPLMTNPPSTSVAVVSIPAGSEPWLGSVRPYNVLNDGLISKPDETTYKAANKLPLGCVIMSIRGRLDINLARLT